MYALQFLRYDSKKVSYLLLASLLFQFSFGAAQKLFLLFGEFPPLIAQVDRGVVRLNGLAQYPNFFTVYINLFLPVGLMLFLKNGWRCTGPGFLNKSAA